MRVFQTLSNLDRHYLVPARVTSTERTAIDAMQPNGQGIAVESASRHIESRSHAIWLYYVPLTNGNGTAVFATSVVVGPEDEKSFGRRFSN